MTRGRRHDSVDHVFRKNFICPTASCRHIIICSVHWWKQIVLSVISFFLFVKSPKNIKVDEEKIKFKMIA